MEGGRHVQTETVRKVVREAHEAREERDRENARPQPKRPRDRRGARQVALDRDQGGGGAPLRHRAALALRRARARGPLGGLPQARRMAEVLQRLLAQEGLRLLEEAQGVLQRQEGAGGSRRRALVEQIRDRRDRGGRRRQARGHQGRPRARALPAADSGDDPRPQRLHRIQVGGRRLRRHDEHGAQAQGRLQAEVAPGPEEGDAPLGPQVARGVPRARRGRLRRGLGDGHRRGRQGRLRQAPHAPAPPEPLPAGAAAAGRLVRLGPRGALVPARGPRRGRREARLRRRAHRQRERVRVSVNLFFTSFAKQARRSRKGGFTGCANVFSPIPVTA